MSDDEAWLFEILARLDACSSRDENDDVLAFLEGVDPCLPAETDCVLARDSETPRSSPNIHTAHRELSTASTGNAHRRPKLVNRSRCTQREELLRLRALATELEVRLARLKTRSIQNPSSEPPGSGPAATFAAAWQYIAKRQSEQRERAEMENRRLRKEFLAQIQLREALCCLFQRSQSLLEKMGIREPVIRPLPVVNDDFVFADLLNRTNEAFGFPDRVFGHLFDDCLPLGYEDVRLAHDRKLGLHVSASDCRLFPFDFATTSQALWADQPSVLQTHINYTFEERTDAVIKARLPLTIWFGSHSEVVDSYVVCRQFRDSYRTVVILSAAMFPATIRANFIDGFSVRYTSATNVSVDSELNANRSKVTTHAIAVPVSERLHRDDTRRLGVLAGMLADVFNRDFSSRHQNLQNRLLDGLLVRS